MDSTQINFSMAAAMPAEGLCISLVNCERDLSASLFLTVDKPFYAVDGLFFSLRSSLESAMFHVREGFEELVISIRSSAAKYWCKARSMWRKRIALTAMPEFIKRSPFRVMRT